MTQRKEHLACSLRTPKKNVNKNLTQHVARRTDKDLAHRPLDDIWIIIHMSELLHANPWHGGTVPT